MQTEIKGYIHADSSPNDVTSNLKLTFKYRLEFIFIIVCRSDPMLIQPGLVSFGSCAITVDIV
jgi:hypothetical protein